MTTRWRQNLSSCVFMIIAIIVTILVIAIAYAYTNHNKQISEHKINFSDNRIQETVNIFEITTPSPNWKKERSKVSNGDEELDTDEIASTTVISSALPTNPSTTTTQSSTHSSSTTTSSTTTSSSPPITTTTTTPATATTLPPTLNEGIEPVVVQPSLDFSDPDLENRYNVEYIKPSKIRVQPLHADDLLYESKKIESSNYLGSDTLEPNHITGHFRNRSNKIWDPHPQYEIDAFGMHLHLILYHDVDFIPKGLKITHVWQNSTALYKEEHKELEKLHGCFYKGHVRGDDKSSVAVSLCDGMRGHIRTSSGNFFIQPVENYTNEHTNILHAFYRSQPLPKLNRVPHEGHHSHHHSDYVDRGKDSARCDVSGGSIETTPPLPKYDDIDFEDIEDYSTANHHNIHHHHSRNKRSTRSDENNSYVMEVLVAIDLKMQEYHKNSLELNQYVLTLMSIVSSIYSDASIGNSISVAVVHILKMKDNFSLGKTKQNGVSATQMLNDFCTLKRLYNFNHDAAVLLTREQICRSQNEQECDTLGLAELGTMCRQQACSIVQDNGLSAAFTIAHELGHILNMPHDDADKCKPFLDVRVSSEKHIMSKMLDQDTHPWTWSNCSRHFVTEFLYKGHGECMLNAPLHDMIEPQSNNSPFAGEKFSSDQQCKLSFGSNAQLCGYMPPCKRLWCADGDRGESGCRTQHMPWADGTTCEHNKWCQKGNCVHRNRTALTKIDGGWGPWTGYGECSRTCGGGIQSKTRECNSPAPTHGGKYCVGMHIEYASCNIQNCIQSNGPDFREQQCKMFDNNNFGMKNIPKNVKWVPKYGISTHDVCKLHCRVEKHQTYFTLMDKVIDGTPCYLDSFNKCVNGICRAAGCDYKLDSKAILDKCGVCDGNGSTCIDVRGGFKRSQMVHNKIGHLTHYYQVARIPKGALNIYIEQLGTENDTNYIALMNDKGGYILNGNNLINEHADKFHYAGVTMSYTGGKVAVEIVNTTYAIRIERDLFVQILILRPIVHDDYLVRYSYTIAKATNYIWQLSNWSDCDEYCMGSSYKKALCIDQNTGLEDSPAFCDARQKPADEYKTCNEDCTLSWELRRSECSATCGDGFRMLSYVCMESSVQPVHKKIVNDSLCIPHLRPPNAREACYGKCEHAQWEFGQWQPCSHSCGSGHQNRSITCLSGVNGEQVDEKFCNHLPRENETQKVCNTDPCPEWEQFGDTPCSVTCGEGTRSTAIICKQNKQVVNHALCGSVKQLRPIIKKCTMEPCKKVVEKVKKEPTVSQYFEDNVITYTRPKNIDHIPPIFEISKEINSNVLPPISPKYEWRTGRWGKCSVDCGSGGTKMRTVRCVNFTSSGDSMAVEDKYCVASLKPVTVANCSEARCPEWNYGNWGECDMHTCKQHRVVVCQNETNEIDYDQCRLDTRPTSTETCCHFKWRAKWTPCSVSCGVGYRKRERMCMQLKPKSKSNPHPIKNGKIMPERYCSHLKTKPFVESTKTCRKVCDFKWETSHWSKCPIGCGSGWRTRNVTCTNGKIESHHQCDQKAKPNNAEECSSTDKCEWQIAKWKDCNCSGWTKRRAVCWDARIGVQATMCRAEDQPKTRMRCTAPDNCSCTKVRNLRNTRQDGEYILNIKGKEVSIYCHNMTGTPVEFVSLPKFRENYSSFYSRRAADVNICPESAHDEIEELALPYGKTVFSKIRIVPHSVRVVENDYTFAKSEGIPQAFGTAGDCFSRTERCPRGVFSINLEGTGFRIRPRTKWEPKGANSVVHYDAPFTAPFMKLSAVCGGYCGKCAPSQSLHLDVLGT